MGICMQRIQYKHACGHMHAKNTIQRQILDKNAEWNTKCYSIALRNFNIKVREKKPVKKTWGRDSKFQNKQTNKQKNTLREPVLSQKKTAAQEGQSS